VSQSRRVYFRAREVHCIDLLPGGNADVESGIVANLARLSPEDRKEAEAQRFCVVQPDKRLGEMGVPVKLMVKGQPVFLCCAGCQKAALRAYPKNGDRLAYSRACPRYSDRLLVTPTRPSSSSNGSRRRTRPSRRNETRERPRAAFGRGAVCDRGTTLTPRRTPHHARSWTNRASNPCPEPGKSRHLAFRVPDTQPARALRLDNYRGGRGRRSGLQCSGPTDLS
jgi:hypothetical protein